MNQKQGQQTGLLGEWLSDYLDNKPKPQQYLVYYDHGDSLTNPNVAAIKGFYGDKLSNQTQLAEVDIMVTNLNHEIMVIVEIEERMSPPKKIIGNIIALLMCNGFSIRLDNENRYFRIMPKTRMIVAGIINPIGLKKAQLENVILPRLQQFTTPQDGINLKNISIFFESDLGTAIGKLKKYLISLYG